MKRVLKALFFMIFIFVCSNGEENKEYKSPYLDISIEEGESWIHKFKVMPLIKIKTRPQMAIWMEDEDGNYIETIFVTDRVANQSWRKAPSDKGEIKRKEALPIWENRVGIEYVNEEYKKSERSNEIEGVAGATPSSNFTKKANLNNKKGKVAVFLEVNHSTDFNDVYEKKAKPDSEFYSGGKLGSGQPSLLYKVIIDLDKSKTTYIMNFVGNGHPAGKDGEIYHSEGVTTAAKIVKSITVNIK